jgi:hypothetical protein
MKQLFRSPLPGAGSGRRPVWHADHLFLAVFFLLLSCFATRAATAQVADVVSIPAPDSSAATSGTSAQGRGVWKDPDGNPLPFQTDEEIIEFLQTAEIVSVEDIPIGITKPHRVEMVKDGVRMRAALRDYDETRIDVNFGGDLYPRLRDSHLFDLAAYELAKILGLDNIPPVTMRRVNGRDVTLQIWLEGALMEFDRVDQKIAPPENENLRFLKQYQMLKLFDTLIGNQDRNNGNILFDDEWNFWLIDHSISFMRDNTHTPYLQEVHWCSREVLEKLKALDFDELNEAMNPPLTRAEVNWVLKRRDRLIERLEQLIIARGEAAVIYDEVHNEN